MTSTFVFLTLSSLMSLTIAPATAQTGYKPSVPQVIINFIDNSYEVPSSTTTVTDPFTDKDYTITNPGYFVGDRSLEVTVKKQPFTPYTDADGHKHNLRYTVEFKKHLDGNQGWKNLTSSFQYEDQYTTITMQIGKYHFSGSGVDINSLPTGSQLDFRVKATVVYSIPYYDPDHLAMHFTEYIVVASSGYSSVQTFTLTSGTHSSTPLQTTTLPPVSDGKNQPQTPDQTLPQNSIFTNPLFMLGIGVLFAGIVIAVVLMFSRRQLKTPPTYTNNDLSP
ncbi:MAG: hypothetical protein LBC03_04150 [Nitrososphaerota archaeon]|nr:hypothetical protein [Nitrososphaerota archaeon]